MAQPVARRARVWAVAGIAGWFGFNAVMGFYTYLSRNSPDAPDFAAGRIMPMHQQARTFYVVPWEQRVTLIGLGLSLILVVAALSAVLVFHRAALTRMRFGALNWAALAAFFGWFVYSLWPIGR
jgi:hypothetical protein